MARTKQATPRRHVGDGAIEDLKASQAALVKPRTAAPPSASPSAPSILELAICVAGIYASFLSWAVLQERITTTPYGSAATPEIWSYPVVLNTIQSLFAALTGYTYHRMSAPASPIIPSRSILGPLLLVSLTTALASPFGYAALPHVGYITFILAKSCKLLPVMLLRVTIFRQRYPLYKYGVVLLVTAGVAVFTLHADSKKKKSSKHASTPASSSQAYGLLLLSINLLFDGLTNSTQDYINQRFAPYAGSALMCAQNVCATALTTLWLGVAPALVGTAAGQWLGLGGAAPGTKMLVAAPSAWEQGELARAMAFAGRHPGVAKDVLAFAACGAIGQLFIFYTLARFSSLLLVTITVTRKMLTMLLSVVWFGHALSRGQWLGVGLVFGGVGAEAVVGRLEKRKKHQKKDL